MRELILGLLLAGTYPFIDTMLKLRWTFKPDISLWVKVTTVVIPVAYLVLLCVFNYLNIAHPGWL